MSDLKSKIGSVGEIVAAAYDKNGKKLNEISPEKHYFPLMKMNSPEIEPPYHAWYDIFLPIKLYYWVLSRRLKKFDQLSKK